MASTDTDPVSVVGELPPSSKLVFKTLEYADGPLTQAQLVEQTRLAPRTVRYGINRLEDRDVVSHRVNVADARQYLYQLEQPFRNQERDE